MSLRHPMRHLYVDELLKRAASVANLAMLRTYAEPSPIQIAAIKEFTSLLESQLSSLHPNDPSNRKRVLEQLNIHRSILAPIRRLPKELLIEIFFFAAYESPLRSLQVAVTLARVCAVWRGVAHGLTKLWTKLVVKSPSDFDGYCKLFLPLTKATLPELRCDNREILRDLWDRIAPYASRWRRIKLEGRLSTLPDLQVLCMENLERLVVDAYDAPSSLELSVLDFVIAPRLRHIALTIDALQSERQLHVPITQVLTSLEITAVLPFPVILVLPLLRACADTLQSLTIKIRQASAGAEGSYPASASDPFVMKALTYLSLVDPACALLDHVIAPTTQELVLCTVPAYSSRLLLQFLTRGNSDHLHTLRVYDVEERDPSAWIPCLQLMCNLRRLHFDDLLSNEKFVEQLIEYQDKPPLLPALEGIAIWQVFWSHLELHDVITDMCSSRSKETIIDGCRAWTLIDWLDAKRELYKRPTDSDCS